MAGVFSIINKEAVVDSAVAAMEGQKQLSMEV